MRLLVPPFFCLVTFVASAGSARADDVSVSRSAYDRGAAAYDAGNYELAASELARADELTPNDVVLELALKAVVKADDPRLGMRLVVRAESRGPSATLVAAASAAREKMAQRVGTITPLCPGSTICKATIDGADAVSGQPTIVLVGVHRVVLATDHGNREAFDARVDPTVSLEVKASGPHPAPLLVPPPPPPHSEPSGISSTWFWIGAAVTAALGGAAIASAVDTRNKHDDFLAHPTGDVQSSGEGAQLRTNLLTGGVALSAVATAVLGLVFVRWSAPPSSGPSSAQAGR